MFLTDGSARKIKIDNETIQFKKTNPKNLSIKHRLSNLIIQALKEIGKKNVTKEQLDKIQMIIEESKERNSINENLKNAPVWIQKIMINK